MSDQLPRRGCLWPMWAHASRPTHEYCGRHRVESSSYCEKHRALSVRTIEERRRPFIPRKTAA